MKWFNFFRKKSDDTVATVQEGPDVSEWPRITQLHDGIEYLEFKNYGRFRVEGKHSQFRTIDAALKSKGE